MMENISTLADQASARAVLKTEFNNTSVALLDALNAFNQQQINIRAKEDSWSAGQIAEHIFKADAGIIPLLSGGTMVPPQRHPAEKVQLLKDVFLDFNAKFKSAPDIIPSNGPHKQAEVTTAIQAILSQLDQIIETQNLFELCTTVDVPVFGTLTRLEWLYLTCYHTQKHIYQLKNIMEAL